jgi:hypothetical protein
VSRGHFYFALRGHYYFAVTLPESTRIAEEWLSHVVLSHLGRLAADCR